LLILILINQKESFYLRIGFLIRYLISFALATVSSLQSSVHMDPTILIQFNSTVRILWL